MLRQSLIALAVLFGAPALVPPPPPNNLTHPSPRSEPARRSTVTGAWLRATERLELIDRQGALDRSNAGARGRINATRDAARSGESFPGAVDRPLSSF